MKLGIKRPFRDVLVIQLERGGSDYEVYWIEPTLLGKLKKEGSARIVTEDGVAFRSLGAAAGYLSASVRTAGGAGGRPVPASVLIESGKWLEFREMRGLPAATDPAEYAQTFTLSAAEIRRLGL